MPLIDRAARNQYQRDYYARNRAACLLAMKQYYASYGCTIPPAKGPIPQALLDAARTEIPDTWRQADTLGAGAYLWHCKRWVKIAAMPLTCPACGTVFFTEESPPC
jgi:hypothetical protein